MATETPHSISSMVLALAALRRYRWSSFWRFEMTHIRIATRRSPLALWQAEYISAELQRLDPTVATELVKIVTKGDKILDVPLAQVGGKGLFTKEIDEALLQSTVPVRCQYGAWLDFGSTVPGLTFGY